MTATFSALAPRSCSPPVGTSRLVDLKPKVPTPPPAKTVPASTPALAFVFVRPREEAATVEEEQARVCAKHEASSRSNTPSSPTGKRSPKRSPPRFSTTGTSTTTAPKLTLTRRLTPRPPAGLPPPGKAPNLASREASPRDSARREASTRATASREASSRDRAPRGASSRDRAPSRGFVPRPSPSRGFDPRNL